MMPTGTEAKKTTNGGSVTLAHLRGFQRAWPSLVGSVLFRPRPTWATDNSSHGPLRPTVFCSSARPNQATPAQARTHSSQATFAFFFLVTVFLVRVGVKESLAKGRRHFHKDTAFAHIWVFQPLFVLNVTSRRPAMFCTKVG